MSQPHRFFAESLAGEVVALSREQAHHAAGVLRLKPGQGVELFDGAGRVAGGVLESVLKGKVLVRISERTGAPGRPEPLVELAFAVPKGRRLDWLLEKTTELGVARLSPVLFQRSVVRPAESEHALRRWRGICIAAARQCRADFLPEIFPPARLADYLAACRADVRVVALPGAAVNLPSVLSRWSPGKGIAILIGPEGGLTEPELAQARAGGFVAARLGDLVLRVETAAVAVLAATAMFCQPG